MANTAAPATTFTWAIANLDRQTESGKITVAHYTISAQSGDLVYSAGAYGSLGFDGDVTTPFSKVTESQVLGWVQDALGEEKVTSICEALQAQLDEQRAPSKAAGVPWNVQRPNGSDAEQIRARSADGTFIADDPATPEDEAWVPA